MSYSTTILVQVTIFIGLPPGLWYFTPIKRFVPLAVVQIIVGILLGPSVLARFWPELHTILIPSDSVAALNAISSLAIVLFAFTMGVHFDGASIRGRRRAFAVISFGSIVTPTLIGVAMGWWMATSFPDAVGAKSTTAEFCLAIGICVGVTAVPAQWRQTISERLEIVTITLLLPFFFVSIGLKTLVDPSAADFSQILVAATLAAILGKVAGTAIPSRLCGGAWSEALCLGFLMQTKGLMEVVVLTILLDSEVITRTVFSAMVCAAVITTALTMPFAKFALTRAKQLDVGLSAVLISPEAET